MSFNVGDRVTVKDNVGTKTAPKSVGDRIIVQDGVGHYSGVFNVGDSIFVTQSTNGLIGYNSGAPEWHTATISDSTGMAGRHNFKFYNGSAHIIYCDAATNVNYAYLTESQVRTLRNGGTVSFATEYTGISTLAECGTPNDMGDHYANVNLPLQIDSSGNPHFMAPVLIDPEDPNNSTIYHAWKEGATWYNEDIGVPATGHRWGTSGLDFTFGTGDTIHVVYAYNRVVNYNTNVGATWDNVETLWATEYNPEYDPEAGPPVPVRCFLAIATNSGDNPYVSIPIFVPKPGIYPTSDTFCIMYKDGGNWYTDEISAREEDDSYYYISNGFTSDIAFDSDDNLHIIYSYFSILTTEEGTDYIIRYNTGEHSSIYDSFYQCNSFDWDRNARSIVVNNEDKVFMTHNTQTHNYLTYGTLGSFKEEIIDQALSDAGYYYVAPIVDYSDDLDTVGVSHPRHLVSSLFFSVKRM